VGSVLRRGRLDGFRAARFQSAPIWRLQADLRAHTRKVRAERSLLKSGNETRSKSFSNGPTPGGRHDRHRNSHRIRGRCLVGLCRRRNRYDSLGTQTVACRRVGPAALADRASARTHPQILTLCAALQRPRRTEDAGQHAGQRRALACRLMPQVSPRDGHQRG
jgi:hypothetical protein